MESSSPPQNEFGGSAIGSGSSSSFSISLNLKISKERKKKDKFGTQNVLNEERHESISIPDPSQKKIAKWRMRERMKTVSVALVYCLNIGVDPPDSTKTEPCARMECWIDPMSQAAPKALENIGKALQTQYERWQPRARYKLCLDPTVEEVKKLCLSLRRNAKDERVLFHYNGHGVPKPTSNGEIWVFNKNFTQYIPLSIYELQTWMGSPSIYVFDSNAAGLIVNWFIQFAEQRDKEYERMTQSASASTTSSVIPIKDFILLASCGATEMLPMNPDLPADVFTSCLTTPIKMALRWFCSNSLLVKKGINFDLIDKIPGRLADRKTPIGELNWIFTAITDTIAWNVLPRELFQKLFRQDLLVASLFRNFLLADRIMRSLNCTPISFPKLPPTHLHPMWQAWDLAVDLCLSQLPEILEDQSIEYKNSPFFAEQLTAFEVWLEFGSERKLPPEQLPIVLQVLLSQAHRLRALILLAKFLDLGPWAVNLALSVGIFPYVLKLLQSPAVELRQVLVFIWAKILALDKSCQLDLVKDNGHNYFLSVLSSSTVSSDQRTMAAFILSVIANNCRPGQSACLNGNIISICISQLGDPDPSLRRWLLLCLGKVWESFEDAKWAAIRESAHERVCSLLTDPIPEVRAAAVYALGLFIGGVETNEQRSNIELNIGLTLPVVTEDASPLVRKELIVSLSKIVKAYEPAFKGIVKETLADEAKAKEQDANKNKKAKDDHMDSNYRQQQSSIYACIWKLIVSLMGDPFPLIAKIAESIARSISPPPPLSQQTSGSKPPVKGKQPKNKLLTISGKTKERTTLSVSTSNINVNLSSLNNGSISPTSPISPSSINSPPSTGGLLRKTSSVDFSKLEQEEESSAVLNGNSNSNNSSSVSSDEVQSVFYDWSCEFFSKPQLLPDFGSSGSSVNEEDVEIGQAFSERMWREKRIESTLAEAKSLVTIATANTSDNNNSNSSSFSVKMKLDEQIAIIENAPESVANLLLHPFEPIVVVADDKDGISVWDRESCIKLNSFKNKTERNNSVDLTSSSENISFSRTSSMIFVNETSQALLATGSDDGVVRIWNAVDDPSKFRLVSSWRAFPGLIPGSKGAGLVLNWQPEHGSILTSGDVGVIRIWDLERELYTQDVPTGSDSCVTSLSHNPIGESRVVVAGCGDGSVRIFDFRSPPKYSLAATFIEHKEWIIDVHVPQGTGQTIVSGSTAGQVKFWDMRSPVSAKTIQAYNKNVMTAMAVHDFSPVLACGSHNQKIKIYNFAGDELSLIRYHDGFLGQRIGPVSCLAFHPYLLMFASGATDSIVSIYSRPTILK